MYDEFKNPIDRSIRLLMQSAILKLVIFVIVKLVVVKYDHICQID